LGREDYRVAGAVRKRMWNGRFPGLDTRQCGHIRIKTGVDALVGENSQIGGEILITGSIVALSVISWRQEWLDYSIRDIRAYASAVYITLVQRVRFEERQ